MAGSVACHASMTLGKVGMTMILTDKISPSVSLLMYTVSVGL